MGDQTNPFRAHFRQTGKRLDDAGECLARSHKILTRSDELLRLSGKAIAASKIRLLERPAAVDIFGVDVTQFARTDAASEGRNPEPPHGSPARDRR